MNISIKSLTNKVLQAYKILLLGKRIQINCCFVATQLACQLQQERTQVEVQ